MYVDHVDLRLPSMPPLEVKGFSESKHPMPHAPCMDKYELYTFIRSKTDIIGKWLGKYSRHASPKWCISDELN